MDLKELEILGQTIGSHWYYASKARLVRSLVNRLPVNEILDVGAGSGFFARYLLAHTDASKAICVDTSYKQPSSDLVDGKSIDFCLGIKASSADLVLLMDVLEHVEKDKVLLSEYVNASPNAAHFVITVPAFQFMWSPHDDFLEHKRRYTLRSLRAVALDCELEIVSLSYGFGIVFPIAFIQRMIGKRLGKTGSSMKKHSGFTNQVLLFLCAVDNLIFRANKVAGLSVVCLARKKS